ncbi:MAG: isochorismatase family protein, partial [Candidatus Saccharimonadales bacterium]
MSKSALLVMDVQSSIVDNMGDGAQQYVERVKKAVDAAHKANIPVMFIVVRFREGYPEMSPNNKMFAAI